MKLVAIGSTVWCFLLMAKSTDGVALKWDRCARFDENCVLRPVEINFEVPIKSIFTFEFSSFAFDIEGNAFYWGLTYGKTHLKPKKLSFEGAVKVHDNLDKNKFIVFINYGKVFICGFGENKIMREIVASLFNPQKSLELPSQSRVEQEYNTEFALIKETGVTTVNNSTREAQFDLDYERQINLGHLMLKNENSVDRMFRTNYLPIRKLGQGTFGEVIMVKEIATGDFFAIKKIRIEGK